MSAGLYGMLAGAGTGLITGVQGQQRSNAEMLRKLRQEGSLFLIHTNIINQNRTQLDNELGGILSDNALKTAKAEATTRVLMSTSGTVGGTTGLVSKQAYMDQNIADAEAIMKGRNQEVALLNEYLSRRINFKMTAEAAQAGVLSGSEMGMGIFSQMMGGASAGGSFGSQLGSALPTQGSTLNSYQLGTMT